MSDVKFTILICDDQVTVRKIATESLRAHGFSHFVEAGDGEAAWRLLNEGPAIDCVICDLNMPGGSGLDLLNRVRADDRLRGLPFIMLTGSSERAHVTEVLVSGATAYVLKPFTGDTLAEKIAAARKVTAPQ